MHILVQPTSSFIVNFCLYQLDVEALDDQVKEKRKLAEDERRRQFVFDQQRARDDQIAILAERQIQEASSKD